MSILDKLMEKKDIEAYLDLRAEFLKKTMTNEILKLEPEDREFIRERFKGRISELEMMIEKIKSNTIKSDSKRYYNLIHNIDEVK